jgi:hypothetical protein
MNVSELIQAVRDLYPIDVKRLDDAAIVRSANTHIRSLFRVQLEANESYHNCEIQVAKDQFKETRRNVFDVTLPSWASRIGNVGKRTNGAADVTLSPWAIDNSGADVRELSPKDPSRRGEAWEVWGNKAIRLTGFSEAIDLTVEVAKLPAKLLRATIDAESGAEDGLVLPEVLGLGVLETEPGAYINAQFRVTSLAADAAGATRNTLGDYRVGVDSFPYSEEYPDDRRTEIQLDSAWTDGLVVGDVVESVVELADEHTHLVTLTVLQDIFQSTNNKSGLRSIGDELRHEMGLFQVSIKPRTTQYPTIARLSRTLTGGAPRSTDRADNY